MEKLIGYGYGAGYGSGSGSGYGSGYGDGSQYWRTVFVNSVRSWTAKQRKRLSELSGAFIAFWKSDNDGYPANGGKLPDPVTEGTVHKTRGPLNLCSKGTLHATLNPGKWKGERLWVVAMIGEIEVDSDKVGALQREILGEVVQPK